jgi:hypothetical protein
MPTTTNCSHAFNNKLVGTIPPQFGQLTNMVKSWWSGNVLSGPIPSAITNLSSVTSLYFWGSSRQGSLELCIIDAASSEAADVVAYNWYKCGCKWLTVCPSGTNVFNTPAVANNDLNPTAPNYPDDATCCAGTGFTLRERLVADGFLDCSTRPCLATAAGLSQTSISYISDATITGTIPPQIATLTAVTRLYVYC